MKIQGKKIEGANEMVTIIPRHSSPDIVFKSRAILNMSEFEEMCPPPEPPKKMLAGGKEVKNLKDSAYLKSCDAYAVKRLSWIVLSSLEATEDLEWEKVDLTDPSTWNNFREEMKEAGLSGVEINRVIQDCIEVNALDNDKIEEARNRFLLETQEQNEE
jgi:hypothetical protein